MTILLRAEHRARVRLLEARGRRALSPALASTSMDETAALSMEAQGYQTAFQPHTSTE